jgi:hypothetical protein
MRTKVTRGSSELVLTRILDAFAQELIDAPDEDIFDVAKDLGMDPTTRMSAAFAGVTYPARLQLSDFFDVEMPKKLRSVENQASGELRQQPENGSRRSKRPQLPTARKTPSGK